MDKREQFQSYTQTVNDRSAELGGGVKAIKALGALKLMTAVDDLHQASGRDMVMVVERKHNATVDGDMQELIEGGAESTLPRTQHLLVPKNWIGA
ncbi:hypothetical protein [Pseudomonas sp. G3-19]